MQEYDKHHGHQENAATPKNFNDYIQNHEMNIREALDWLNSSDDCKVQIQEDWLKTGELKLDIEDESEFCDGDLQAKLLQNKTEIFEKYDADLVTKAKVRANPFETIKNVFFMNRAAMKMANIDARTSFMFTGVDRDPKHKKSNGPYYFADVCAGPGGFSEYVLWRKKWSFKGFGFTLKGVHDFQLDKSTCCMSTTFRSYYGSADDGNVCNPENIKHFAENVRFETDGEGVHFMMSDGGFSVEGQEELQEILSKQLYTCQCLVALEIIRTNGHFVTKLFDTFTKYSIGLIFLMYLCFDKIAILKPNTSRPANAERYLICQSLKSGKIVDDVKKYLRYVTNKWWQLKLQTDADKQDINEIVPSEVLKSDEKFCQFITQRNNDIAMNQIENLEKIENYCLSSRLIDGRQEALRQKCLFNWNIPNLAKEPAKPLTINDLLYDTIIKPELLNVKPTVINIQKDMDKIFQDVDAWTIVPLNCSKRKTTAFIFAAIGASKVYKLQNNKWCLVKNLRLDKGTILYGEVVTEKVILNNSDKGETWSLHVIDALRLGHLRLSDFNYNERVALIETYCKAVNFETCKSLVRIRQKPSAHLSQLLESNLVRFDSDNNCYYNELPVIGMKTKREYHQVNSLLLMKTDETYFFNMTFALRTQLYIDEIDWELYNKRNIIDETDVVKYIFSQYKKDHI